jgi:hypothetical protein
MQAKQETFGPVALTTTMTTNVIAPAAAGAGGVGYTPTADVIFIGHIRVINKTGAAATYRLFKGATGANAAGTELSPTDHSVPANGYIDLFFSPRLRLEGANGFIVGGASALTTLTLTADGEVGKV